MDSQGLIPTMISRNDASGSDSYSMGAAADSFYEYLLKVWMLRGKKVRPSRDPSLIAQELGIWG